MPQSRPAASKRPADEALPSGDTKRARAASDSNARGGGSGALAEQNVYMSALVRRCSVQGASKGALVELGATEADAAGRVAAAIERVRAVVRRTIETSQ